MAESGTLLRCYRVILYRGFESLLLQDKYIHNRPNGMTTGVKLNKLKQICLLMLLVSTSVYSGGDNIDTENLGSSNHFAGNYMGINIGYADSNSYSKDINHNDNNHHYSSTGLDSYNLAIGKNWIVSNSYLIGAEAALGYMLSLIHI